MPALRTPANGVPSSSCGPRGTGPAEGSHMSRRPVLSSAVAGFAVAALTAGLVAPASAADVRSDGTADRAVAYLASHQQPSGGFGGDTSATGQFVGSETVDAVLAIG